MLHNNIAVDIFDCFLYHQPGGKKNNLARDYCALSYRVDTDCKYHYSGKNLHTPKGSLVFVPAGVAYDTSAGSGNICVIHFHILNRSYKDIELLYVNTPSPWQTAVSPVQKEEAAATMTGPVVTPAIHHLFMQCIEAWEQKPPGYQYKVTAAFYQILELAAQTSPDVPGNKEEIVSKCTDFIHENFMKPELTINDIAEYAHISETYLRQLFRRKLQLSPKEYLTDKRIQFAKYLLGTGYFEQYEISQRCGFSDVKYFRFAFKKSTGMTIKEYKEDYRNKLEKSRE